MAQTELEVQFQNHMAHGVDEGVLIVDEAGVVLYMDETATTMLHTHHLVGQPLTAVWPTLVLPKDPPDLLKYHEVQLQGSDGEKRPFLLTSTPLTGSTGQHQLISIMRLPDVARLNDSLTHAQRLAGIGRLARGISYELTNPISIITATCSNLQHDLEQNLLSSQQLQQYIERIEQNAWRSVRIMETLRSYTHPHEAQATITDLNLVIRDAVLLVQNLFETDHHIQIEVDLAEEIPSLVCDHHRMIQVIVNLLTNARDAIPPEGGTITVRSWHVKTEDKLSGFGAFSVSDTGSGIPQHLLPAIFQPFFSTKPADQGTGLGLFIVEGIVSQHGGRVWAENNPDGGATVTVWLPQKQ